MNTKETLCVCTIIGLMAILFGIWILIKYPLVLFVGVGSFFIILPLIVAVSTTRTEKRKTEKFKSEFLANLYCHKK